MTRQDPQRHGDPISRRELVRRTLGGAPVPRPAAGPLAVHFCAQFAGVTLRQYTTDARVLAECIVRYYEQFRPDAVWLSADTWVTAQAMGAAVTFLGDDQPLGGTGEPLVRTAGDIERIPPPDPTTQGRQPLMLEALRRVRAALGDEVFIVACFDQYPFSLACALMGLDQVMLTLIDDRPLVEALMERCAEYGVAYGKALAAGGADMLSGGDSPAGLIGPQLYREVALPFERRVIGALHSIRLGSETQATGGESDPARLGSETQATTGQRRIPVSLHICGNATPILADMRQSEADVLELDHQVALTEAARVIGPEVAIWGNLDPVGVLARGTPESVRAMAEQAVHAMAAANHRRFVLSSGCTLAVETPTENLHALLAVAYAGRS